MMICPTCKTHYADDTLKFCLQDGTQLAVAPITETPTVVLGETETVELPPGQNYSGAPPERSWEPTQVIQVPSSQPYARKSNTGKAVLLTALGMLVIFGIIGVSAWNYLKGERGDIVKNDSSNPDTGRNTNSRTASTVASTPAPTNTRPVDSAPPPINSEEIKNDVKKTIMTWKSMAESHDLDSYMGNYAGTVDYYLKKGASRSFVRDDKRKHFENYTSIHSDITNMDITLSPSGEEATVLFDKEWDFDGVRRSTGKVRQEMRLKNINGEWLITTERDLKVYYKN